MPGKSPTVTQEMLQRIIKEEIAKINEQVDHKAIAQVSGIASKLMAAVVTFKEKASPAQINATTPHLGELEKILENMLSSPGSYVPRPRKEPKKVSLTAKKAEGIQREGSEKNGKWPFEVLKKVMDDNEAAMRPEGEKARLTGRWDEFCRKKEKVEDEILRDAGWTREEASAARWDCLKSRSPQLTDMEKRIKDRIN